MLLRNLGMALALLPALASAQRADLRIQVGPNHRASAADTLNRNEGWIAASLTNPKVLVAVSHAAATPPAGRRCATMVSADGGNLWREVTLPRQDDCFDPMVTAAPDGRLYILHTATTQPTAQTSTTGQRADAPVRVFTSNDDGKTWRGPADLRTPLRPDHPRLAVDQSDGAQRGRVYVAWNEVSDVFMRDRYHIFLHYSDDHGATFSEPILLQTDSGGKLVTTEPIVLSDGTLLVTYYQYFQPLSSRKNEKQPFYILRSTDGAKTFNPPEKVLEVGSSAWPELKADFPSAFTLPIITADHSRTSQFRDRLYVVWDDVSSGASNIWLTWSADKGKTWSPRIRVNDNVRAPRDGPADFRMTPVVAVNRAGVVGVAWYDRREDVTRRCWKKYFAASLDGGQTFSRNVPVSSAPSCPSKDTAPRVLVKNATPDSVLPSPDSVAKLIAARRFGEAEQINLALERRAAEQGIQGAQLRVSFDRGRSVWPGHYTGLTADTTGAFHALWADRRSGYQQMYSARIDVTTSAEPQLTALIDTIVTELVQVIAAQPKYDEATGTSTVELQLRNVSTQTVYGPLRVRLARVISGATHIANVIDNSDTRQKAEGTSWDFSTLLGTRARLEPGMVSEAKSVLIRSRPELGLDVVVAFEVLGRLRRQ
ncbi:MAG: sialidase family protein [Longimicrobiales bacterium]